MYLRDGLWAATLTAELLEGDDILYFPLKIAVSRLGGVKATAQALEETDDAVQSWLSATSRSKPEDAALLRLSKLSGVSLTSFHRYFSRLEIYKARERFRRR